MSSRQLMGSIEGKRSAWLNQNLLIKLENKTKMHRQWKWGWVLWEVYRDRITNAKAQLDLNLARTRKNKKSFCRCINWKRKVQEGVLHLVINTGRLVTTDKEIAEALNFFALVFASDCSTNSLCYWVVWR